MVIARHLHLSSRLTNFIVVAIAVLCSINILPNDFCFDDIPVVRDNQKIQGDSQWGAIWATDYWSQTAAESPHRDLLYRPISLSLFRLTRLIAGSDPLPFHLVSILLNALCAVLVAHLVRVLCGHTTAPSPSEGEGRGEGHGVLSNLNFAPLVAGLVFAVLPIHTEVVASVVGQTDLLATVGTISAILCHFRFVRASTRLKAVGWMVAEMACAFTAMGAKESGICVVPLVVIAELLGLPKHGTPGIFRRIIRTSYLLVPLAAYLALRFHALGGAFHQAPAPTKTVNVLVDAPMWQHALGVLQAWGMYWAKSFYPRELCIEYAINTVRLATSLWQFHVLLGLVWAATLVFIVVWGWRRGRKELVFVASALVIAYLPTSNAFVLIQVYFAERIWYLPSVFVSTLVGLAAIRLLDRRMWRIVGISMLAVMAVRCWVRNSEWKNNGTLFAATYADHPQSVMARHLYGQWLTQNGEVERGITLIQKALEIDQGFTDAQRSLGKAYLKLGRIEDALHHFQIADMQVPGHPDTQQALSEASAALQQRAGPELKRLEQTAHENPDDVAALLPYIRFLRSIGQTHEALGLLEQGTAKFENSSEWAVETAITLVYLDRRDDAIGAYRRALQMNQTNAQLMVELAMLLIERRTAGDIEGARKLVDTAIELQPKNANVHAAFGEVQALEGDIAGARDSFRQAIQLASPGSDYSKLLSERAKAIGQ